jgi:hypothetical protein
MRWWWMIAVSGAIIGSYVMLSIWPSMKQKQSEVFRREAGGTLHFWKSLSDASQLHWPYAWAAVASYQDSFDSNRKPLEVTATCPEPHAFLSQRGWVQWTELPLLDPKAKTLYSDAAQKMRDVHLRAEVWSNAMTHQVVVAFGGTAASSWNDWKSNLRWFVFKPHDEYTVLSDTFLAALTQEYQRRENEPDWAWLKDAHVIPTGHSLGGGLAQRFAYSRDPKSVIPKITEVYAFDPSPVSGKRSSRFYRENAPGLTVYHIYNRGEILASLRSLVHIANPGDRRNQGQTWVDIRYRDNWTWRTLLPTGTVHAHGMWDLARFMARSLPSTDMPACQVAADK